MKKYLLFLITVAIVSGFYTDFAGADAKGEKLLSVVLDTPESSEHRSYLGLDPSDTFRITDITCDLLVVEIFSMYCPHCQAEAPNLNAFYQLISKDDTPGVDIRIIGIGVGNSKFEVNYFKETYDIPFPLFPDKDFVVHRLLGEVRTPYFFGIKMAPDAPPEVFMSEAGPRGKPGAFLNDLLEKSGLK